MRLSSVPNQCKNCLSIIDGHDHPVLRNAGASTKRFCSVRCLNIYVTQPCAYCDEPVGASPLGFHRRSVNNPYYDGRVRASFCSQQCRELWKEELTVRDDYLPAAKREDEWESADDPVVVRFRSTWSRLRLFVHGVYCRFRSHGYDRYVVVRNGDPIGFRWDCDRCGSTGQTVTSVTFEVDDI